MTDVGGAADTVINVSPGEFPTIGHTSLWLLLKKNWSVPLELSFVNYWGSSYGGHGSHIVLLQHHPNT